MHCCIQKFQRTFAEDYFFTMNVSMYVAYLIIAERTGTLLVQYQAYHEHP